MNNKTITEEQKDLNRIVKKCFNTAFWCILVLTILAGFILILNCCSQCTGSGLVKNPLISYETDSNKVQSRFAINYYGDSSRIAVINANRYNRSDGDLDYSNSSDWLNSIVSNLTLAVNSVNNVLTAGSILIAILTLFIAVIGLFAYHNLKTDIKDELNKTSNNLNQNLQETKDSIEHYKSDINSIISEARDKQESSIEKSNKSNEDFKNEIKKLIEEVQKEQASSIENINKNIEVFKNEINNRVSTIESFSNSMVAQARYFNKSIDFLYFVSSTIIEKVNDASLRDILFHDFYINSLFQYDFDPDSNESKTILHRKKAALEFLKDKGTLEDIKDLETIAENESNEEIIRKVQELIGIIKHKFAP